MLYCVPFVVFSNHCSLYTQLLYLSTDDTESSDEDVFTSPDHKRQCSDRGMKKISTTCTPQSRSTSQPKHSSQARSARKSKTRNK